MDISRSTRKILFKVLIRECASTLYIARVDQPFPIGLIPNQNSNIPAFRQHWSNKIVWYVQETSFLLFIVLLLPMTQRSGYLVAVTTLYMKW